MYQTWAVFVDGFTHIGDIRLMEGVNVIRLEKSNILFRNGLILHE